MISITLPSLYPDSVHHTLDNLERTTRGPYEVILVGWSQILRSNVVNVAEVEPRGCAHAHHLAAQHARGDYLLAFADDHEMVDGWDEIALTEFETKRQKHWPFALGLRGAHSGHVGSNFGYYYPYFPLMTRADVRGTGWIGPDYRAGFGDSDLAMRVWFAGGRCEWSDAGLLRPTSADKRKAAQPEGHRPEAAYTKEDLALFISRWAPIYGNGWSSGGRSWDAGIDDFNVDLRPEANQHLADGNTFCFNDPDFMRRAVRMIS